MKRETTDMKGDIFMKKMREYLIILLTLLFTIMLITACDNSGSCDNSENCDNSDTGEGTTVYKLRDTGPAGGIIFYINPNAATDGWTYLEAAPVDIGVTPTNPGPFTFPWSDWGGPGRTFTGADRTAIGTGKQNTRDLIKNSDFPNTPADICRSYEVNGYFDWFLPSIDELHKMYVNLHSGTDENGNSYKPRDYGMTTLRDALLAGGFRRDSLSYWSSSEIDDEHIWSLWFSDGTRYNRGKEQSLYIRPVRAF